MCRRVRVETLEELIALLEKIEVRIGEDVPRVFPKKDHYIVKIDDMYRYTPTKS